jgi:transcriptional regulator with XRE-family HTH domain
MERRAFAAVFGDKVSKARDARGLSQEELAELAGIHRTHVSFIERGVHVASLEVALRIAHALDVSLATLVGRAEREWRKKARPKAHRTTPSTRR